MTKNTLKYFLKTAILLVLFITTLPTVSAQTQVVYQHNFNTYVAKPPYTVAPSTFNASLSNSSWTNNLGTNWAELNGVSSTNSLALDNSGGTKTITLTFDVAPQKQLEISSYNFWRRRSGSGAQNWAMTINGINAGSGIVPETGALLNVTPVSVDNVVKNMTGRITVVLTLTGASGSGTFRLDDFTLNGSVTNACTPATITSISPASGPANTEVTINGSGFINAASTTAVKINGVNASTYTVVSDNVIKAKVAAGTTSGPVEVTTNNCTGEFATPFTILATDCLGITNSTDLFISEIYDAEAGQGGVIEIYNGTSRVISLGDYQIRRHADSATTYSTHQLSNVNLAPGSVYLARVIDDTREPVPCGLDTTPDDIKTGFNDEDLIELAKGGTTVVDAVVGPKNVGFSMYRSFTSVKPKPVFSTSDWTTLNQENCTDLGRYLIPTLPQASISGQPQSASVCENGSATFTATINALVVLTYQWKTVDANGNWVNVTNTNGFSGANSATLTVNPATAALNGSQYYLEARSLTCVLITNAVQLTVTPSPLAPLVSGDVSYCQNATAAQLTATATGTNTLVWYDSLTSTTPLAQAPTPGTSQIGETTYYVSQRTTTGCESPRSAIKITIITPTPTVATFTLPTKVCTGSATLVTPDTSAAGFTTGGVYSYTTTGTGTLTLDTTTGIINPATSTAGTYVVTYTVAPNAANCIAGSSFNQTIEIGPLAPAIAGFSYINTTVCNSAANEAAQTVPGFVTGGAFTYTTTGTGILSIDAASGEINVAASAPGTYTVTYTVAADAANCSSQNTATATFTITPSMLPVTGITYEAAYCTNAANDTPDFDNNYVAGGRFTYTGTGTLVIEPTTGEINIAASTPGTYTVTYTVAEDAAKCQELGSSEATIVITPLTVPTTDITYLTTYCESAANATPGKVNGFTEGGTYTYTGTGTLAIDAATGEINFSNSTVGTYTITYTVAADAAKCQGTNSSFFDIEIIPFIEKVTDFEYETSYCYGTANATPIDFASGFTAGGIYSVSGGLTINPATGEISNLAGATAGTYTVTYTVAGDGTLCNAGQSSDFTFTVGSESLFTITAECVGNAYTITGTPTNNSFDANAVSYAWSINGTSVGTDDRDFDFTDYIRRSNLTLPVTVTLTVINGNCSTSNDFIVEDASCEIQRGISPGNGDDKNNFFDLAQMGVRKLVIFNRYGKEVYSKNNYTVEWHGQTNSGDELPTGTYFYTIERTTGAAKTGWIYINRQN